MSKRKKQQRADENPLFSLLQAARMLAAAQEEMPAPTLNDLIDLVKGTVEGVGATVVTVRGVSMSRRCCDREARDAVAVAAMRAGPDHIKPGVDRGIKPVLVAVLDAHSRNAIAVLIDVEDAKRLANQLGEVIHAAEAPVTA